MLSMSLLHHFHKMNILSDIICSSSFYHIPDLYYITSYDILCDCDHIPLCCPRKRETNQIKNNKKEILNQEKCEYSSIL